MYIKPVQTSFLEYLISNDQTRDGLGEISFPKGFEVRDFSKLRSEFEELANRFGLSLPAKLKRGVLILEWKPLSSERQSDHEKIIKSNKVETLGLTDEEVSALSGVFGPYNEA